MRAVFIEGFDGPVLSVRDCEAPPHPEPEEVVIDVHTAPISFATTLVVTGKYQFRPELPFVPGAECSGIVRQVGSAVKHVKPGDRVVAMGARRSAPDQLIQPGTLATATTFDMENVMRIPDTLTLESASLLRANYETAFYGLGLGRLTAGETLLVLGAGGGTGYAAVTIGKALGARVIGSASTDDRRELAKLAGADEVMDMRDSAWREEINRLTGGRGIDCVYDPVGGQATERAFRLLRFGGRHVVIGFAAGSIPSLPVNLPLMKGASLIGANLLRASRDDPENAAQSRKQLWEMLEAGKLALPVIARRYTLDEVGDALHAVASGNVAGRVVISVNPELERIRR